MAALPRCECPGDKSCNHSNACLRPVKFSFSSLIMSDDTLVSITARCQMCMVNHVIYLAKGGKM